mmetsp:Transcript_32636/g.64858  ORF Transcript_32636/g.64858 Transcript_32636/m.64858 type:complete len:151 (-) Transcript_32636:50-502(-)
MPMTTIAGVREILEAEVYHNENAGNQPAVIVESIEVVADGTYLAQDAEVVTVAASTSDSSCETRGRSMNNRSHSLGDRIMGYFTVNHTRRSNQLPVATPVSEDFNERRDLRILFCKTVVVITSLGVIVTVISLICSNLWVTFERSSPESS